MYIISTLFIIIIIPLLQCFIIKPIDPKLSLNALFKTRSGKKPLSNSLLNQDGATHITELVKERIKLSQPGPNRRLVDPKLVFISNVDIEITDSALENFFSYVFGPLLVQSNLEKYRHKGFGKLIFNSAELATIAMLEYNGVKLGRKSITLSEVIYSSKKDGVVNSKLKNAQIIIKRMNEHA